MPDSQSYTISEAAALTGLHRNTIRGRIRLGQLQATIHAGKFGEEYRITHAALVEAGLLLPAGPLDSGPGDAPPAADLIADAGPPDETPAGERAPLAPTAMDALAELYRRHEQALFRLGYLQGELERARALAENAESLREDGAARERELQAAREALARREQAAADAETLRGELEAARRRLAAMEAIQADLEALKELAARQEEQIQALELVSRRRWWHFWKR